jgi:hypothetical protein
VKEGSATVEGTARVVSGTELDAIREKVVAKYGIMTKLTKLLGTIGGIIKRKRIPYGDRGVIVKLFTRVTRRSTAARGHPFPDSSISPRQSDSSMLGSMSSVPIRSQRGP